MEEQDRASLAYQVALAKIGADSTYDAYLTWQEMPESGKGALVAIWLTKALNLLLFHRGKAEELGLAYYRLVRAIRTGSTVRVDGDKGKKVSLRQLRDEFRELVPEAELDDFDADIPLEDWDFQADDLSDEEEWDMLAKAIAGPGIGKYNNKLDKLDYKKPASEVMAERIAAKSEAGSMVARTAGRLARNAGRDEVQSLNQSDPKAIGYVRISKSGKPCHFCAMLISREIFYKSKTSAGDSDEGAKWHDDCNCVAVPVYSENEFETSPLFAQNREFSKLWKKLYRKGGYAAWRNHFDNLYAGEDRESEAA